MAEFEFDLRDIFRIVRRRRWVIILSPILVALLTYSLSSTPPPDYEAESLVKITRVAANVQSLLIEALSWYQGDNIATQSQIITSRKIRARVALRLSEKKYSQFEGAGSLLDNLDEKDYDTLEQAVRTNRQLAGLVDGIAVAAERKGDSDVVGIMATASSADLAIDIANYTAEEFVNYNIAERNSEIREAVRFIQSRIRETERELTGAERELEEFKRENTGILGLDIRDNETVQEQIDRLGREIATLDRGIEQLKRINNADQYLTFSPALSEAEDSVISRLEQQLLQLIDRMDELRSERRQLLTYRTERSKEVEQNAVKLEEHGRRVQEIMATVLLRYRVIREELTGVQDGLLDRQALFASVPEVTRGLEALQRQVALRTEALNLLQRRLQDAEIQQAGEIREVTIVEQASFARTLPQRSRIFKALLGLLIGAILGAVFAVVLESLDTSIGTIEDVERYLEIPVLGVIPHLDRDTVRSKMLLDEMGSDVNSREVDHMATLVTHFAPTEPVSEAFRSMRAQLEVMFRRNGWKTLLFTSSVLQEGKTNTVCNLGVVFAQSGQRTVLVDADLRRPQLSKVFGLSNSPGLSEVLLEMTDWQSATRSIDDLILGKFGLKNSHLTPGLEYLFLLTSGRKVDNPAELLNVEKVGKILDEMRDRYDIIIVDGAPVLPVADAAQLTPRTDATLLAYQIGRVGREVVNRSRSRLQSVGGNVVGLVMNDIAAEIYHTRDYEYYGYKYKYEENPPSGVRLGWMDHLKGRITNLVTPRRREADSQIFRQPSDETTAETTTSAPRTPRHKPERSASQPQSADQELEDIMKLTDED